MKEEQGFYSFSKQTLKRLPYYYNYLKALQNDGVQNISAPVIAKSLNLNEVQVRKDLATVSESGGKPKTGFKIEELIKCIEHCLGYDNINDAILIGSGKLGMALLSYTEFENYGIRIVAAFDSDNHIIGTEIDGKPVFSMEKLPDLCRRLNVHIGIITVPSQNAQSVCDMLVKNGILAIWNFAPVHLVVPDHILVQNENMAVSLALLSKHLQERLANNKTTPRTEDIP
ncbi:redox-sensing transcriptional repressor Rex [Desulfitobacterium sp. Sab5]|uniref:redox-sensing transcriptional repressor Rex n=1 Tax=Desulfitobacterium nosdiversum TaxID=3375356 RepID=UPI003CEA357F